MIGGWWIEPDCNIPGGESFVRQALYGQRYLHEKFGITATTGANIDSFGHNATIPQILAKSGCDSYVFLRPGPKEKDLGPLFWWESPDGSRVLAYRIPHEYCAPKDDIGEHVEKAVATLPEDGEEWAVFYGVGNHGGGPTIANLEQIRLHGGEPLLARARCARFFDSVGREPRHPGDRRRAPVPRPGCYTTHSGIKRWNRRAENLLHARGEVERVADSLGAQQYPAEQLREAWKLLLFNQFHDTLAGTSIAPAYDDARDQLGHASSIAANAFNAATQSIARQVQVDHEEDMRPVVVFNPHPWPVSTDAEIEYTWMREEGRERRRRRGQRGAAAEDARADDDVRRARAARVPGRAAAARLPHLPRAPVAGGGRDLAATTTGSRTSTSGSRSTRRPGASRSLVAKATGADLADPSRKHAVVIDDRWDTWGHDVEAYDQEIGEFEVESVKLVETAPCARSCASRRATAPVEAARGLRLGANAVGRGARRARLARGAEAAEAALSDAHRRAEATYETPYGHIVRPSSGHEEPGQSWVDVSGDGGGLAVINDSKYGYDVRGGDIGISAVRSPVWAWHDPRELEEGGDFEYMDHGRQTFRRPARPARGRLARRGRPAARRRAEPAAVRADRDVPRRAAAAAPVVRRRRRRAVVVTVVKPPRTATAGSCARRDGRARGATRASSVRRDDRGALRAERDQDVRRGGEETNLLEW